MLGEGRVYMLNSWWIAAFPGLAIFVTTLAINLMGNGLRDWLGPHEAVTSPADAVGTHRRRSSAPVGLPQVALPLLGRRSPATPMLTRRR